MTKVSVVIPKLCYKCGSSDIKQVKNKKVELNRKFFGDSEELVWSLNLDLPICGECSLKEKLGYSIMAVFGIIFLLSIVMYFNKGAPYGWLIIFSFALIMAGILFNGEQFKGRGFILEFKNKKFQSEFRKNNPHITLNVFWSEIHYPSVCAWCGVEEVTKKDFKQLLNEYLIDLPICSTCRTSGTVKFNKAPFKIEDGYFYWDSPEFHQKFSELNPKAVK